MLDALWLLTKRKGVFLLAVLSEFSKVAFVVTVVEYFHLYKLNADKACGYEKEILSCCNWH